MRIPGDWQAVLIVTLLVFLILGTLLCAFEHVRRWRRASRARRARRPYERYRPVPDERDSLALFRRLHCSDHRRLGF